MSLPLSYSDETQNAALSSQITKHEQGQREKSEYSEEQTSQVTFSKSKKPTFDRNLFALEIMQVTKKHFLPVTAIAYEPQI